MTISIISPKYPKPWVEALKQQDPSIKVQVWPNDNPEEVTFALCWDQPEGLLQQYPNLKCICSMGAGVDHLLKDKKLPKDIPIIRLVDPGLNKAMFEYVRSAVLYHNKGFERYRHQQNLQLWQPHRNKPIEDTSIGILGLGKIGQYCAIEFSKLNFKVSGWSRTTKKLNNVKSYAGDDSLTAFLNQVSILICLLPLTKQTSGILNTKLFNSLEDNACLINVARGEHLNEEDLIEAINKGKINHAFLDVFKEEPLGSDHTFWKNNNITITPHCSSITDPFKVAPQIVENYHRNLTSEPLLNRVSLQRGY